MARAHLAFAASLLASPLAEAQLLIPVAQDRNVFSEAEGDDLVQFLSDSDGTTAPDFAPFTASSAAEIEVPGEARATCGSFLMTEILPNAIVGSASCFGNSEISVLGLWLVGANGGATISVDFQVPTKVRYDLTGSLLALDSGCVRVRLDEIGGDNLIFIDTLVSDDGPVDESGVLSPGITYRYHAVGNGGTFLDGLGMDFGDAGFDLAFLLSELVTNYCTAAPNSAGPGAVMGHTGSVDISANTFALQATGAVPNGSGIFYYGPNEIQAPFADGFRCVGGMSFRLQPPLQSDASGTATRAIDFTAPPVNAGPGAILPGSTWKFQLWYRDQAGPGGTGSNMSDGLSVQFCP